MNSNKVSVKKLQFFPGGKGRLVGASAELWVQFPPHWQPLLPTKAMLEPIVASCDGRIDMDLPGEGIADVTSLLMLERSDDRIDVWLGALTVLFQRLAGDHVLCGEFDSDREYLILPWQSKKVFHSALQLAAQCIFVWQGGRPSTVLHALLEQFIAQYPPSGVASTMMTRFAYAASKLQFPYDIEEGVLALGWGAGRQRLLGGLSSQDCGTGISLAKNKMLTRSVLLRAGCPVTDAVWVQDAQTAAAQAARWGWPVVLKPVDADQGVGVVMGLSTEADLARAIAEGKASGRHLMLERQVKGGDFRFLVVKNKVLAACQRIPAHVIGDGCRTVEHLIESLNTDAVRRAMGVQIKRDNSLTELLQQQGVSLHEVPELGRRIQLSKMANISRGGSAVDCMADVHPENIAMVARCARVLGLAVAGVDLIAEDISRPWYESGACVIEVNAQPGLRPHWLAKPFENLESEILKHLFPSSPRIPVTAITGSNGKTTVTRMLHDILMQAGRHVGSCTTEGVYLDRALIRPGHYPGYSGAKMILADPLVDVAVLEMTRKTLLDQGHPCDRYEVAALLNIQDDHIGVSGIESLADMAAFKATVLSRADRAIVVNAEDPHCVSAAAGVIKDKPEASCELIYVGLSASEEILVQHIAQGARAVSVVPNKQGQPCIGFWQGGEVVEGVPLSSVPVTFSGQLRCNVENALFAAALAWANSVPLADISRALSRFECSWHLNPGRFNYLTGFLFEAWLDYAHNPDGVKALCQFLQGQTHEVTGKKRALITHVGNRHRHHITECAPVLAESFDEFIIGCQANVAYNPEYGEGNRAQVMLEFFKQTLMDHGVSASSIRTVPETVVACQVALGESLPGDVLVLMTEPQYFKQAVEGSALLRKGGADEGKIGDL